jgi:hypothetical protein
MRAVIGLPANNRRASGEGAIRILLSAPSLILTTSFDLPLISTLFMSTPPSP